MQANICVMCGRPAKDHDGTSCYCVNDKCPNYFLLQVVLSDDDAIMAAIDGGLAGAVEKGWTEASVDPETGETVYRVTEEGKSQVREGFKDGR